MFGKSKKNVKFSVEAIINLLNKSSRGALVGSMVAALICMMYFAGTVKTGLPLIVDVFIVVGVSLMLPFLIFGLAYYAYTVVQNVNKYIVIAVIGTFLFTRFLPDEKFNRPFIFLELISGILVGIAFHLKTRLMVRWLFVGLALAINLSMFALLVSKGSTHAVPVTDQYWDQKASKLLTSVEDPIKQRPFTVKEFCYGSGTDKQRAEYGPDVQLRTMPVNGSSFMQPASKIKSFLRKTYWGFGLDQLPLNARVWMPQQPGTFPLIVFVHGNHLMTDYSEKGYAYMGSLLASQGFVVVSIDENFLNESWFNDFWFTEVNARAWLILKHLEYMRTWSANPGNPFYQRVDMNNICLAGHSRGADAVAVALTLNGLDRYPYNGEIKFNFRFSIKSIVQLAPAGRQSPGFEIPLENSGANFLILHGSHDQDVYYCEGIRSFNRVKTDTAHKNLKAMLYIYKANHGQFNSVWGIKDLRFPNQYFVNSAGLLSGADQQRIAGTYVSAFLKATMLGEKKYIPLLKDCRTGFDFLPRNYYVSQFEDYSFRYLADYEEDQNLRTTGLQGCFIEAGNLKKWYERVLPLRNGDVLGQDNKGVFLEWNNSKNPAPSYYTINLSGRLPGNGIPGNSENLFFSIANNSDQINQVNFSIELRTRTRIYRKSFNDFYTAAPLLKTELAKWNYLSDLKKDMPVERVLQFIQLPFSAFKEANADFDPRQIEQIRFVFDKQPAGSVILDKIGYN